MIGPGGLLLVILHLFAVPVSVLWVGLQKSMYITKLGCEKYYHRGHILSTIGDALTHQIRNHEANIIMDLIMVGQKAPYAYKKA
jgi:hypothetical protein